MKRYFIGIFPAAAMAAATLLPGCENENNVTGGKANISVPSQVALDDIAGDGEIRTFDVESDGYWSVIATGADGDAGSLDLGRARTRYRRRECDPLVRQESQQ